MKTSRSVIILLMIVGSFTATAYAQDDVTDFGETTIKKTIPEPPNLSSRTLPNPGKAIEIKLEESFIPKITESMKKNPF